LLEEPLQDDKMNFMENMSTQAAVERALAYIYSSPLQHGESIQPVSHAQIGCQSGAACWSDERHCHWLKAD